MIADDVSEIRVRLQVELRGRRLATVAGDAIGGQERLDCLMESTVQVRVGGTGRSHAKTSGSKRRNDNLRERIPGH